MERLEQLASGICHAFPCIPAALFGPTASDDGEVTAYFDNQLNQYMQINSEAPTCDAGGNMLTWNGWNYTRNRENRLIGAEKGSIRFEADYDYMGRRFEKKVYEDGVLTLHRKFAYYGYKLVAEFDALNDHALIFACLWQPESQGLDVPLMMTHNEVNYYYIVDGNKNVVRLVDSSGTSVADYLYGPFGQVLESSGPLSEANPFRFSSEYHDSETGLVYYNYRYYNPSLGRWTKRDPIGEEGGVNLYGMCGNNVVYKWDRRGTSECKCGPDIKAKLQALLDRVEEDWSHFSEEQKSKSRLFLDDAIDPLKDNEPAFLNGWDIVELTRWFYDGEMKRDGKSWLSSAPYEGCAKGKNCEDTVEFEGKCYYIGSVNYILFGKIFKLIGGSQGEMEFYIKGYKGEIKIGGIIMRKAAANYDMSVAWAKYGYDASNGVPEAEQSRIHCTSCGKNTDDTVGHFRYYWYPYSNNKFGN